MVLPRQKAEAQDRLHASTPCHIHQNARKREIAGWHWGSREGARLPGPRELSTGASRVHACTGQLPPSPRQTQIESPEGPQVSLAGRACKSVKAFWHPTVPLLYLQPCLSPTLPLSASHHGDPTMGPPYSCLMQDYSAQPKAETFHLVMYTPRSFQARQPRPKTQKMGYILPLQLLPSQPTSAHTTWRCCATTSSGPWSFTTACWVGGTARDGVLW